MQHIVSHLAMYAVPLLISAGTIATAVIIALLGNTKPSKIGHVYRVGRKPARLEASDAHGRIAVSVRTIDQNHVWMRIEAPTDTVLRVEGEGEPARDLPRPTEREQVHG